MVLADNWKWYGDQKGKNLPESSRDIEKFLLRAKYDMALYKAHKGGMNTVYFNGSAKTASSRWRHNNCGCNDLWSADLDGRTVISYKYSW